MSATDTIFFEISFRDHLTNPLQQATNRGVANLNRLEGAGGKFTNSLSNGFMGILGPAALATAGLAAFGAGLNSVLTKGMDFTKTMSQVKALVGANEEEFKKLNQTAISLGASTVFSSTQVGEAMKVAAQQGQKTNDIIKSLPGYLDLASSSNIELADAVEIGLSTMHQFGLAASEMQRTTDKLAYASTNSANKMQDMAESLKYAGPGFASLKIPLSETLASIMLLADNGLKGSIATRALSTGFQRLASPTEKVQKTMKQLNISFFDSDGKFIGLNNTIELLSKKMNGFTDEQKSKVITDLFGADAYGEINILIGGVDKLKKKTDELNHSQGTAQKISKEMLNNLSGDYEQLSGAIETLQLNLFGETESGMRSLTQASTDFVNKFNSNFGMFAEPIKEIKTGLSDIYAEFQKLFGMMGQAGEQTNAFIGLLKWVKFYYSNLLGLITGLLKYVNAIISFVWRGAQGFMSLLDTIRTFAGRAMEILEPLGDLIQGVFTFDVSKVASGAAVLRSNLKFLGGEFMRDWKDDFHERVNGKAMLDIAAPDGAMGSEQSGSLIKAPNVLPEINAGGSSVEGDSFGSSGKGRGIVVNIENLVEAINVNAQNAGDIKTNIQNIVAEALTNAVRDFETSYQ